MLRTPNKPLGRNNRVVLIYLILFIVTLAMNCLLALSDGKLVTLILISIIWTADIIMFISVWCSKGSFIEHDPSVSMISLMETFDAENLCPFCRVIRLPKSRHCNICNRCVDRYDHHCPWVNNCIGRTNHTYFYLHLLLVLLYCITSTINSCVSLFSKDSSFEVNLASRIPQSLLTVSIVTLIVFGLFFGLFIGVLVVY